ncbi:MAG: HD domain-containing protein [Spirochaetales bacterium]|nr:HD domain-containing protein [Spirochaetales bacterium]
MRVLESALPEIREYSRSSMPGDYLHGSPHIERVLRYAGMVNREIKGDWPVIEASVYLHDVGHSQGAAGHPVKGAEMAVAFLSGLGIDGSAVERVGKCIRSHSRQYSKVEPESKEARVLFDADGMDLFGPVGLARGIISALKKEPSEASIVRRLTWRLGERHSFYSKTAMRFVRKHSRIIEHYLKELKDSLTDSSF